MMLPPVEDSVLRGNPEFAKLYNTLTAAVLNPDSSTKNDPNGNQRVAVQEVLPDVDVYMSASSLQSQKLKKHRVKRIKQAFLVSAVETANPAEATSSRPALRRPRGAPQPAPSSTTTLPPELLSLIILLPPLLTTPSHLLDAESTTLILTNPPFTSLPSLLPSLTPAISSSLISRAASLSRLLNPSTNPSFIHRTIPSLPTTTASLTSTLANTKSSLSAARSETATALTHLLSLHALALKQLIRALESKHGNVARGLELRAAEVAVSAARQELDSQSLLRTIHSEIYTPQAITALKNYNTHLRDGKSRLREEIRGLKGQLAGYGVRIAEVGEIHKADEGKERTMREMARVYREMSRQLEEGKADLGRLARA